MPIYMDVHIVPGVKARDVAEAHTKDILIQNEHACKCMTYWIDEDRENVFCLIEAPAKEAVIEMHDKAHGLIPHKIIEVSSSLVESFLGRIYDPADAETTNDGLKVFSDPSFRILLITKTIDPVLLQYKLGSEKANELLNRQNSIVRKHIAANGGSEVEHGGPGFIISFASASKAVSCALAIRNDIADADAREMDLRIGINAGEPIEKSNRLFGDVIDLAEEVKLDGIVAANTTISRQGLKTAASTIESIGAGGLSGKPVQQRSTQIVQKITQQRNAAIPVIASGGIFNGHDALEKMQAGASLVQVWTGFIYEGPGIVKKLCSGLVSGNFFR